MGNIERLSFMESKILELGRKQHEKGYQGGTFTPGFVRKETEYGYRAINVALESLIALGLVEKTVTSTFRNGSLVELDVYKITSDGLAMLAKIDSGEVKIDGKEPPIQKMPKSEPKTYSKPWEPAPKPRYEDRPPPAQDFSHAIKALETTIRVMAEDLKKLHAKVDGLQAKETPAPEQQTPRKKRAPVSGPVAHRLMILNAVKGLEDTRKYVLAEDVKDAYVKSCAESGVPPKGTAQFTSFLKRLEGEGIVALKRVGCKNLGIKGQGSRVVVSITTEGQDLLDRNA